MSDGSLRYFWDMLERWLMEVGNMLGICLRDAWDMLGICLTSAKHVGRTRKAKGVTVKGLIGRCSVAIFE